MTWISSRGAGARALLLTCALLLVAGPSAAQRSAFSSSWLSEERDAELQTDAEGIRLSLEEAVMLALSNNLGLRVERFRRAQSLFQIQQQEGIYDFNFSFFTGADESKAARGQHSLRCRRVDRPRTRTSTCSCASWWRAAVPSASTTTTAAPRRTRASPRSTRRSTSCSTRSTRSLSCATPGGQPLSGAFVVARTNSQIGLESLKSSIIDTVQQVENAYWTLVESREQLAVDQESLDLAVQLHEMNKVQVRVGTKAPLELIQSEVGIATRQEAIVLSRAAVEERRGSGSENCSTCPSRPCGRSPSCRSPAPRSIGWPSISTARSSWVLTAGRSWRRRSSTWRTWPSTPSSSRTRRRPRLDLDLRYGYNGIGGDVLVFAPGSGFFDPDPEFSIVPGGYSDAFEQISDTEFDSWSVGFNFAVPLQNRAARAASTIADLALAQGQTELAELVLQVRAEIRRAARAVETAAEQIDSAGKSRELAERNLEAEQKRYENGLSTSFQVLEIQEDLSLARSREVRAITTYRRAIVDFFRAIGTLLEETGIEIDDEQSRQALKP